MSGYFRAKFISNLWDNVKLLYFFYVWHLYCCIYCWSKCIVSYLMNVWVPIDWGVVMFIGINDTCVILNVFIVLFDKWYWLSCYRYLLLLKWSCMCFNCDVTNAWVPTETIFFFVYIACVQVCLLIVYWFCISICVFQVISQSFVLDYNVKCQNLKLYCYNFNGS